MFNEELAPPGLQCAACVHLRRHAPIHGNGDGRTDDAHQHVCASFPNGIPAEILSNKFDHRVRHELDNGTMFAPVNNEAKRDQAALFTKGGTG